MDQPDEAPPASPDAGGLAGGPPPEFQNPESPRYQPWAEKQITNAVKEKRPLEEFMAEFDSRVAAYGDIGSGNWDPQHQDRLLAKFSPHRPSSGPSRHRRRRSPGAPGAQPAPARAPGRPPGAAPSGRPVPSDSGPGGERRRRRRRRPRGGRRPPEASPVG